MSPAELTPIDPGREQAELYPPEPEVHLRDYWYVVLKRRWVIATITIIVLSLSTVNAFLRKPVYTATALVQINRGRLNVVQGSISPESWFGSQEFYPTQKRVLSSFTLAERVADDVKLWQHPSFRTADRSGPTPEDREALASAVRSMLNVSHVRNSQLMEVSFTTPDRELSARLANALVTQYIAFSTKNETDIARDTASFFGEQIEKLHGEIQEKEKILQEYSQRQDILLVDQKENIVLQQLEDLNHQLSRVRGERAAADAHYKKLQETDPHSLKEVLTNPSIQNLKNQRASLQNRIEELSSRFASDWPELQRARDTLEKVELRLDQETGETAAKVIDVARMEYLSVGERERLLQQAVEEQKQEARKLNQLTADFNRIKVELENKQTMLQQLLRRHSESGMNAELGEGQAMNVRPVERALVPKAPSGFTVRKGITWGLMLGLFLGIGLAFFLEYWDSSIHTVEDLRRRVPLPYLGIVPRHEPGPLPAPTDGSGSDAYALAPFWRKSRSNPSIKEWNVTWSSLVPAVSAEHSSNYVRGGSVIAERFKFIRGSLLMSNPGRPPRVVLVAGPDKNAGKTFVACNLATSLTELKGRVLLIDADLRNPHLHRVFRIDNEVGLSNVLTGQVESEGSCIVSTPIPNLSLLAAGPPSPSPSELLGSTQMQKVLERCSQKFDFVLLDSAPLLPVFDSHLLTAWCDASLLVVRSGQTSYRDVNASLELVDRVGGKMSGVVLNAVDLHDFAQSYYYSYHSYNYGQSPDEPDNKELVSVSTREG